MYNILITAATIIAIAQILDWAGMIIFDRVTTVLSTIVVASAIVWIVFLIKGVVVWI